MRPPKAHIILTLLVFALSCCTPHKECTFIQTADSLLWTNPDSCRHWIEEYDSCFTSTDNMRLQLIYEHALFKTDLQYDNDSILHELSIYFDNHKDFRSAGEAKYIQGALHVQNGKYFEATEALKQAEHYYNSAKQVNPILMGMLYFNLGVATERNRLFDTATEYYQLAVPFLRAAQHPLYTAAVYHNLSKSVSNIETSLLYIDSALFFVNQCNNTPYKKEIEVSQHLMLRKDHQSSDSFFMNNLKYLCDTCMFNNYAGVLANEYLQKGNIKEASTYIEQLTFDTIINIWSKEQYYVLSAELLKQQGKTEQAYLLLKEIHKQQTEEIEQSAYANTYIISQKYDAAKEQEMRLQEQVKKQRAYFWIAIIMMICVLIGGYTYYINKKRKLELRISKEEKKRLEEELNTNRAVLRARISERLEMARHLHFWSSHHSEDIPDILGPLSPKQAASDQQNWREFCKEFDLCYGNLLLRLKKDFPELTDSDLQYIVITFLDFDMTDMSFLLQITNRTIWNRRNSVKQHIGMSENTNLDNWIINDMAKEYNIAEPKRNPRKKRK